MSGPKYRVHYGPKKKEGEEKSPYAPRIGSGFENSAGGVRVIIDIPIIIQPGFELMLWPNKDEI